MAPRRNHSAARPLRRYVPGWPAQKKNNSGSRPRGPPHASTPAKGQGNFGSGAGIGAFRPQLVYPQASAAAPARTMYGALFLHPGVGVWKIPRSAAVSPNAAQPQHAINLLFQPEFLTWNLTFLALSRVKFQWMKRNGGRRDKPVGTGKLPLLGREKKKKKAGIGARTQRGVQPRFGGLWCLGSFLRHCWLSRSREASTAVSSYSPNAIDPGRPHKLYSLGVVGPEAPCGSAHTEFAASDVALAHARLGISSALTMSRGHHSQPVQTFGQGQCTAFFSGLWSWQLERLPGEFGGIIVLDLDSTVLEALRGAARCVARAESNGQAIGRPSIILGVAVLARRTFCAGLADGAGERCTRRGRGNFLKGGAGNVAEEKKKHRPFGSGARPTPVTFFWTSNLLGFLEQGWGCYLTSSVGHG